MTTIEKLIAQCRTCLYADKERIGIPFGWCEHERAAEMRQDEAQVPCPMWERKGGPR